jgi:lectin-like protein
MCSAVGKHLVEIDSSAELQYILANVAQATPTFWLGEGFGGGVWSSATGCPAIFKWATSEPTPGEGCANFDTGAMHSAICNNNNVTAGVICEGNSLL